MIVVSHDRYFLNRVVDLLIVLEPNRCEVVYGNYDTYELLHESRERGESESDAANVGGSEACPPRQRQAGENIIRRRLQHGRGQQQVPSCKITK